MQKLFADVWFAKEEPLEDEPEVDDEEGYVEGGGKQAGVVGEAGDGGDAGDVEGLIRVMTDESGEKLDGEVGVVVDLVSLRLDVV